MHKFFFSKKKKRTAVWHMRDKLGDRMHKHFIEGATTCWTHIGCIYTPILGYVSNHTIQHNHRIMNNAFKILIFCKELLHAKNQKQHPLCHIAYKWIRIALVIVQYFVNSHFSWQFSVDCLGFRHWKKAQAAQPSAFTCGIQCIFHSCIMSKSFEETLC